MNGKQRQFLWGVLALAGVVVLIGAVLQSRDRGLSVFAGTGYWIVFALCGTWFAAWWAVLPPQPWREWRGPCLLAALGVAVCVSAVPLDFKVLSDETNLLNVSLSMYQDKTALHPVMGHFYYGNFHPKSAGAPTRPLVFPFLLSLLHTLTGYRAANAFVLNAAVLFSLLFMVSAVVWKALGFRDALAAVLLVLSQPIIAITAASGGFDLLSATLMLGVLLAVRLHLKSRTADSLTLVWMTLLVYSQVRYESIFALPLVMGFLALRGYVTLDMLTSRAAYYLSAPLFLFPWVMQRRLQPDHYDNPPGVPPFSAHHFFEHVAEFCDTHLDFGFYYPYDNLLNIAAALLFAALLAAGMRRRFEQWSLAQRDLFFASVLLVGAGLGIFLAHYLGRTTHPTAARFFIPICLALAGIPLWVRRLQPQWFSSTTLLASAAVLCALYLPVAGECRFMHTLTLHRSTRLAQEYLSQFPHRRLLTISDRPGQCVALGLGAVDFPTARRTADEIALEHQRRLFDEVIVFQEVEYDTEQPIEEHRLPTTFPLELVQEHQITAERKLRISRLTEMKKDAPPAAGVLGEDEPADALIPSAAGSP